MMPLQNVGRSAMRMAKNYTKGYSDTQTKVREATSNDPWGPSGSQMNELAQLTYNQQDFIEVMEMLDKRLNDKGKNWRHVFKALTVLDYILHAGSENVVLYFQENIYVVKTLREFVYVDEEGKDQGSNVRQKAKDITNLLMDDARIREQRKTRSNMRDRMSGYKGRDDRDSDDSEDERHRRSRATPQTRKNPEDEDLARAIEESKRMAQAEQDNARRNRQADSDLEEAMRLSREEEERRKRLLAGNDGSLFDPDNPNNAERGPNFGWDSLIDTSDSQPRQQMPQPTGMAFGSFNPYAAQLQQQQEEYARMQQQLEMQRQMELQAQMQAQAQQDAYNQMMAQQAYLQQQQQQQLLLQQQQQQAQPLIPQHTSIGSNNPFAAFSKPPSPPPAIPAIPSGNTPPALATRPQAKVKDDGKYSHLAGLLGNREDGIDTFGNVGQLRYGTSRPTGTNPFQKPNTPQNQQQQQANAQPFFEI